MAKPIMDERDGVGIDMKRVIVKIDRLVLIGFRHEDRQAIAEGLQQELAQDAKPQRVGILAGQSIDRSLQR